MSTVCSQDASVIGTKEAIDGILEFESWSGKRYAKPKPFHFGKTDHAIDHFSRYHLIAVATVEGEDNEKWAVFPWPRYGTQDIWLTRSKKEGLWSEPILLDLPGMPHMARMSETRFDKKCGLEIEGEAITVTCDGGTFKTSVKESLKDSDGDGLPDVVEARFLTDPSKSDSDKDGVVDGKDCNPLTPIHSERSDEVEIRQAVFSVLFATCSSRDAIMMVENGPYAEQEYYGFGGGVLRSTQIRDRFVNVTGLKAELESETTAGATIRDWEGSAAASVHKAKLKKTHGKWVVVEFALTRIS